MIRQKRIFYWAPTAVFALAFIGLLLYFLIPTFFDKNRTAPLRSARTISPGKSRLGEPFGIASAGGYLYISDGLNGKILRGTTNAGFTEYATGLSTPSAIAFDPKGNLIVADTGSHTIKSIDSGGHIKIIAGIENEAGDVDGNTSSAKFNAPIGVAVRNDGSIIVADTYNDKIRLIRNGQVSTLAGGRRGYADGIAAQFDTPCGVAILPDGRTIIADTQNARLRIIESNGLVWTLAGDGKQEIRDGLLSQSSFYRPSAIAISKGGSIFISDGNAVREIKPRSFPFVETISGKRSGFADGKLNAATFNRISAVALDDYENPVIADSDNAAIRLLSADAPTNSRQTGEQTNPQTFRELQPPRWPYDPPAAKRDVAGTLGEIRGEVVGEKSDIWFHNGLDIAGAYGETARFIRDETVLRPVAAENFGTLREMLRLPSLGYIHIRLGRDSANQPFQDARFQFSPDMKNVRVPRGSRFKAGDAIGTLNSMNHVHLIAGAAGDEMNALDALTLPGITDSIAPIIENVALFDQNWRPLETIESPLRIKLVENSRIVVRAYDRMDGNPERRRLGVFRLGYQTLKSDGSPISDVKWNINFDRNPDPDAIRFAYATGSKSGATGETIFNYIVTNTVNGNNFSEGFLPSLPAGNSIIRVYAADFFGNTATKDVLVMR